MNISGRIFNGSVEEMKHHSTTCLGWFWRYHQHKNSRTPILQLTKEENNTNQSICIFQIRLYWYQGFVGGKIKNKYKVKGSNESQWLDPSTCHFLLFFPYPNPSSKCSIDFLSGTYNAEEMLSGGGKVKSTWEVKADTVLISHPTSCLQDWEKSHYDLGYGKNPSMKKVVYFTTQASTM